MRADNSQCISECVRVRGVTARECPADMEWTECLPLCGSTCESLAVVGNANAWHSCLQEPSECLPGCKCSGDAVFDRSVGTEGSCVAPTECNCHFQGDVYSPQSTITVDCNEWSVPTIVIVMVIIIITRKRGNCGCIAT